MAHINTLIEAAEAAQKQADTARKLVEVELTRAIRLHLKVGDQINLIEDRKGRPYLFNVRTMRGNDRGTKIFRIESEPVVSFDPKGIELSTWACEATPISEKNGKAMSGRSHGADGKSETVRLVGNLIAVPMELEGDAYREYVGKRIAEFTEPGAPAVSQKASGPSI